MKTKKDPSGVANFPNHVIRGFAILYYFIKRL